MNLLRTFLITLLVLIISCLIGIIFFRPNISDLLTQVSNKQPKGQYTCNLDAQGQHIGKLYHFNNNEKKLIRTSTSNSCIFSRPNINTKFSILAIGGGGGATPFESGLSGQVISKHQNITEPVLVIKVGKGGQGTFMNNEQFFDAQDGENTIIKELKIIAHGGSKSTRMTPLGTGHPPKKTHPNLSEKHYKLYNISKTENYGIGGEYNKNANTLKSPADNGNNGIVVIQW